jgi:hypothetical protein
MSGSSQVSICNRALAAVGTRSTISALTEGSPESNNCALIYEPTRAQLSRAANWNFLTRMATLSLLIATPGTPENQSPAITTWQQGLAPPPPWLYEYAYPSDCLRMRRVVPQWNNSFGAVPLFSVPLLQPSALNMPGVRFRVATDYDTTGTPQTVVLTDASQAIGEYTADIDIPTMFDPDYEEALVQAMAGKLVLALTGDKALAKLRLEEANAIITGARVTDGNEGGPEVIDHDASWISARGAWGGIVNTSFMLPYGPLFTVPA